MKQKLLSRKFMLATGSAVAVFLSQAFGVEIAPEALGGLALLVASYVFGESYVDSKAITAAAEASKDTALATVVEYAKALETELVKLQGQLPADENTDTATGSPYV